MAEFIIVRELFLLLRLGQADQSFLQAASCGPGLLDERRVVGELLRPVGPA